MLHLAAAEKLLSTSSSLPLQSAQYRWERFWVGVHLRDAQTVVLAQVGTPALFVPPAASETVILCIKYCFQCSSWWDSGFGSSEQEIQAACKTLKPHIPTCPGWVKQTGLHDVVCAADPQLSAFNRNNSKKEHTHRGVASGIDFLRDWGRSEAVRSLTFPFAPV